MLWTVREGDQLRFYRRTIAGTYRLYLTIVEWGIGQTAQQCLVDFGIGVAHPTRQLLQRTLGGVVSPVASSTKRGILAAVIGSSKIGEFVVSVLAILSLHILEMNATLIDTDGSARLHASRTDAVAGDAFGEMGHGGFGDASTRYHLPTDMHQAVEEGAAGDDDGLGPDFCAPDSLHAHHLIPDGETVRHRLYQQLIGLVLPDVEIRRGIQHGAPFPDKLTPVALGTRTPNGRSLAAIEHTELDGGGIGHQSHLSTQRIYLAHDLSLGNTTDGRIARHLRYLVHIHGDKQCLRSHVG